ncbi:MAG: ZIP family metal transporter [Candidatus Micrarchaeia archaeon]|jgi:zinc and cadmium transporter
MEGVFFNTMLAVFVVSAVSLVGILALSLKQDLLDRALFFLVSFATGAMIGAAFGDLLPEAIELGAETGVNPREVFLFAVVGILVFFAMEKFLHWYHCHKGKCDAHTFKYLSLFGDALHNFVDGMVIATAFLAGPQLGIVTTIAIIAHEIPQEIGDFALLVYGGFSRAKALAYNFLIALIAFAGALAVLFVSSSLTGYMPHMLAFGAGGFIYIATADLMPELHKHSDPLHSFAQFILLVAGVVLILLLGRG